MPPLQWIYGKNLLELVEFPSDYGRTTKTTTQKNVDLTLYQWIPTHETILGFYRDAYAAINRINNVIRNIGAADFLSEDDKNRMLGEARSCGDCIISNWCASSARFPSR